MLDADDRYETRRGHTPVELLSQCDELIYLGTAASAMEAMRLDRRATFNEQGQRVQFGETIFERERDELGRTAQFLRSGFEAISRREEGVHEDFQGWMQRVVAL